MRPLVGRILHRAGIYYAKRPYMPYGIDWLWDIHRILRGRSVKTVFDVGANIGQTTRLIKERFTDADVHAFEPVSSTYRSLERRVQALRGVTCHRLALSDGIGQATVTAVTDSQLNRMVSEADVQSLSSIETVDMDSIDHFCAAGGITSIDILKVDAEGADLRVLLGGQSMLRQGQVAFVYVEVGFLEGDRGHVHFRTVYDFLEDAGLKPRGFYEYYFDEEDQRLVFANLLFTSPAAIDRMR